MSTDPIVGEHECDFGDDGLYGLDTAGHVHCKICGKTFDEVHAENKAATMRTWAEDAARKRAEEEAAAAPPVAATQPFEGKAQ